MLPSVPDVAARPEAPSRRSWWLRLRHAVTGSVLFLVVGNLSILGVSFLTQRIAPPAAVPVAVEGVPNLVAVDGKVWRGGAPGVVGYRSLAASGVTTVVDLRAEDDARDLDAAAAAAGLTVLHLPVRDGQLPTDLQIAAFRQTVEDAPGTVFVHCGAGVGRTGAMSAAYLVGGGVSNERALARNLAVGPPSLEQIVFAAGLDDDGGIDRPSAPVVAVSRVLDAPRRLWSALR